VKEDIEFDVSFLFILSFIVSSRSISNFRHSIPKSTYLFHINIRFRNNGNTSKIQEVTRRQRQDDLHTHYIKMS